MGLMVNLWLILIFFSFSTSSGLNICFSLFFNSCFKDSERFFFTRLVFLNFGDFFHADLVPPLYQNLILFGFRSYRKSL